MHNNFKQDHKVSISTFLHGITPFMFKEMVPNSSYSTKNRYFVDMEPANSQVFGKFTGNWMHVFVPMTQLWVAFNKFWNGGGGLQVPYRTIDLNDNTDNSKLAYYLFPEHGVERNISLSWLVPRAYQKTIFDIFMRKYYKLGSIDINTENIYQTSDGVDTTTLDSLAFAPFASDYYNEIVNQIYYGATATEIAAPFDWTDLKNALVLDNFNLLKRKFGVRMQDFIDKVFKVDRKPTECVKIVNFYQSELIVNDVVNTADDQGKLVSKAYGITPKVDMSYHADEFGILLGLFWVTCDDMTYSQGIPYEFEPANLNTHYSFFHPEAQGLFYDTIYKRNINVHDAAQGDGVGYTEGYNRYRKEYNKALGEFAREALRGNNIPHFSSTLDLTTLANLYYPNKSTFAHLFANSAHHLTMHADIKATLTAPIAKVLNEENILSEFDKPLVL